MRNQVTSVFPGGGFKAVTLSYDDGIEQDRRLIEIMNRYGIKGTFNLNSALADGTDFFKKPRKADNEAVICKRMAREEFANLYKGHEIAVHGERHLMLDGLSDEGIVYEILADRQLLEKTVGTIIKGMAYAYGCHNEKVRAIIRAVGIEYARTTVTTGKFFFPEDFLLWHPTAKHTDTALMPLTAEFLANNREQLKIFMLWGHSFEFDCDDNWPVIEEFCRTIGGRADIWYATNGELYRYSEAFRQLRTSCDGHIIHNASGVELWLRVNGEVCCLSAGETRVI